MNVSKEVLLERLAELYGELINGGYEATASVLSITEDTLIDEDSMERE